MKHIGRIFTQKQKTIGGAAIVLMFMVVTSGLLGLVRWRVLNARFTPEETGVFLAAFRIPNLLFDLLATGALTAAFIPVFSRFLTSGRKDEAHCMASAVINITILLLGILSLPILLFTKEISHVLVPGFSVREIEQMVTLTRIMVIVQVVPLLVGNFLTGILQSYTLFVVPAFAPIVYNIGMIAGIMLFSQSLGLLAPVVGVGFGAFLFFLIQVPLVWAVGYRHRLTIDRNTPGVSEVGKLMAPRVVGLAIAQIDGIVDLMLASILGSKMVTVFYLAQSLQQLPVRLFGITVAQAALPTLSATWSKEESEKFHASLTHAISMVLFFVLPVSALFIVLRIPIVRLIYGAGRFDWEATVLTGATLSAFGVSLFAQAISHILIRAFYAIYDSKTPVVINGATISLNVLLSLFFVFFLRWPIWSLGVSASIASIMNAGFLFLFLYRRIGGWSWSLVFPIIKMIAAAIITGVALYIPMKLLDQLVFDTTRTVGLILLTGTASFAGLSTYIFLSWVLGVGEVTSFFRLLKRVKQLRSVFLEPAEEIVNSQTVS